MKNYVRLVEKTIINALAKFDIISHPKNSNSAGVWVDDQKIGFIGMRVTNGITYHGFSLNINNDLESFKLINPCGIRDMPVTSISKILKNKLSLDDFIKEYIKVFAELFQVEITEVKTSLAHIPKDIPV